jgi:hypothetical protein
MTGIIGDASDFYRLSADLAQVGAKSVPALRGVMLEAGNSFRDEWKANATATAGEHGVHYPDSIEADLAFSVTSIAVDVGPNPGKPQGGMSFEFGSSNQPPHLDGLRALDAVAPRVERIVESAIGHLFG